MAKPELTPEQNAHLRAEMKAVVGPGNAYPSINKLALALGMQGPSLAAIFKDGGASKDTARKFAALVGRTYEQVLGDDARIPQQPATVPTTAGRKGYRPTPSAMRKARVLLRQPPQNFSDEAIDIAEEDTLLYSPEDADRPGAVAEALRNTILGSVARMPPLQVPPAPTSSAPPAGTRRSRSRGR